MRKVYLVRLIIISFIVHSLPHATCCKHHRLHLHSKKDADVNERAKRGLILLVPYDDNDATLDSNENAREKTSAEVQEFANQLFPVKVKRDPQDASKILLDYTDVLDPSEDTDNIKSSDKEKKPYYLMKSIHSPKEVIRKLIEAREAKKNKRDAGEQESIPIILGKKINRPRNTRSRKYMCLCQETDCQGKECYTHARHWPWKNQNLEQSINYENDEDTSAEETNDINVGAYSEYTQKVIPTQITTIQPTKFNIPFANNINFDQRVIVNNNDPEYQFYQKSNPYGIPLPKYIYNGATPAQQYYPTVAPTAAPPQDYINNLGQNFGTMEECIRLYGRPVCVISSTPKPATKIQTIDLSDDTTVRTYSAEREDSTVGAYYSSVTENPVIAYENEVQSQIPPTYQNKYVYQADEGTTVESDDKKSVEEIDGVTIYLPDSATESVIDPNYAENVGFPEPSHQYQPECPSAPKYSVQTVKATTSKLVLKEPITYRSLNNVVDSHVVNENEVADRQYYEQALQGQGNLEVNDPYYAAGNSYIPSYSSREMIQNGTYENMVGQQQMYDYSAYQAQQASQAANLKNAKLVNQQPGSIIQYYGTQNIQQEQQKQQLTGSYAAASAIYKPTYTSQELMRNDGYSNFENMNPTYIHTNGYQNQPQNVIQTANFDNSKAATGNTMPATQYIPDRIEQIKPLEPIPINKHIQNLSSKEIVKNESYENKIESSKIVNTISNTNQNVSLINPSAQVQNPKSITERSENRAVLNQNENVQKVQLTESHIAASSKYLNNYSSKEIMSSEIYENNVLKQTIDTKPPGNHNRAQKVVQAATTVTPYSNAKTSKFADRQPVQVVKYRRNENPRLIKLTGSQVAPRSNNTNNIDSKKNSKTKNYKNTIKNNGHPADYDAGQLATSESLSTPESLFDSMENSDSITGKPLQVVQYRTNENAQLVKLTGSNIETRNNYGDIYTSKESNNNNYTSSIENSVPVNKYSNINYYPAGQNIVESMTPIIPSYSNVENSKLITDEPINILTYNNNETPQLTKLTGVNVVDSDNLKLNTPLKKSVNKADYENNIDYQKSSNSYLPYHNAQESKVQTIRATTPLHDTVESENVQQLKLTGSYYADSNDYIPNYSSKEFINNNNQANTKNSEVVYPYSPNYQSIQNSKSVDEALMHDVKYVINDRVEHVTESYPTTEYNHATDTPDYETVPQSVGNMENLVTNNNQSPSINYYENKNTQYVTSPYTSNNYAAYVTDSQNLPQNEIHTTDSTYSKSFTNQQADAAKYYHYSNTQQGTYQQYPTTSSDYSVYSTNYQSLPQNVPHAENVENVNSHTNQQADAAEYYQYTNAPQGTFQHYPTTSSPYSPYSNNYQSLPQKNNYPRNIENANPVTYQPDNLSKYYDANGANTNPTNSYSTDYYNMAHHNFQMTATPTPLYNNHDYYDPQQNVSPVSAVPSYSNFDNSNPTTDKPVQILKYYEKNAQSPKPIYVYASGNQNMPQTSPAYDDNSKNRNYYTTTVKIIDFDDPVIHDDNVKENNPNNYGIPKQTYNYMRNVPYSSSNIPNDDLSIQIDKSAYNLEHDISAMPIAYSQHSTISAQNPIPRIPQASSLQKGIIIQPPKTYKIEDANKSKPANVTVKQTPTVNSTAINSNNSTKSENELKYVAETVTTLEDVEDEEYKNHFNPERTSTLRAADNKIQSQAETKHLNNDGLLSIKDSSLQLKKPETNIQVIKNNSNNVNMTKLTQTVPPPESDEERAKYNDALFKGLEKIILQDDDIPDLSKDSGVNINESNESTKGKPEQGRVPTTERNIKFVPQKSHSTEAAVQSVDERPLVVPKQACDPVHQYTNEALTQIAVKKVINNLVPGKAQDLMANYGSANAPDIVGAGIEDLLPDIINNPALRNLFSLPEVENMITDTAGNLLTRLTGLPIIGQIPQLIRNALHGVIDQIPSPHPTVAPMTVEEHRLKDGEWVTERVSLLEKVPEMTQNPPREVFDRIKSIINRSALREQMAAQPVIENLIIKTVKHSLDKERGIIDESAIRQAFNLVVQQNEQKPPKQTTVTRRTPEAIKATKPIIPLFKATTPMDAGYKIAPIIPVTEHIIRNGQWYETQKNLVGKQQNQNSGFNEDKRKDLEGKLEMLNKTKSENPSITYNTQEIKEYNSNAANVQETEKIGLGEETMDESIEREPIKYYSPNDRILEYIKNHKNTDDPYSTTMGEIIGKTNEYSIGTTAHPIGEGISTSMKYSIPIMTENPVNTYYYQPSVVQSNQQQVGTIENNRNVNDEVAATYNNRIIDQPSSENPSSENPTPTHQMNMLVDPANGSLKSESQTKRNDQQNTEVKTETARQAIDQLSDGQTLHLPGNTLSQAVFPNQYNVGAPPPPPPQDTAYLGRLVPMDYQKASKAKDLTDLQDSNLVYVGDGVRLPLTIRKMQDGTFALTLSDEVCKQFMHKQCPCCLPSSTNGVIVRERRNGDVIPQLNFTDDESTTTSQDSEEVEGDSNTSRIRRDSSEISRTTTAASDVQDVDEFVKKVVNANEASEESKGQGLTGALNGLLHDTHSLNNKKNDGDKDQMKDTNDNKPQYNIKVKDENRKGKKDKKRLKNLHDENESIDDEAAILNGKFNYQNNPIVKQLSQVQRQHSGEIGGPPYRYQRHVDRYMSSNGRAEAFKNMLNWMKELVV